ncbi:hypothetical protein M441DRAFT_330251 [Trichoderma asperellum CBS 433.97]|uniref:Uncharacterized protein n=1 Tax=Trichoderma asperellum (strain ATCC 204424 / CBS 433.97 / NBRC 101777) TaxID=1042311 RepID=A0A2T3YS72_TRIA4|nr:hypothetical protein M441DRAFT_330251 [Trichoderma asperellum CBS 433.97]PTB35364.1 hypothetical protein M441DRAFT_330251 [Trichoderma asperellum CBS 433.97]
MPRTRRRRKCRSPLQRHIKLGNFAVSCAGTFFSLFLPHGIFTILNIAAALDYTLVWLSANRMIHRGA